MEKKDQAALTALRDELRKTFEPYGARVEQFDIQLSGRALRWRSRTPDYPAHHVGGAFEEWTSRDRLGAHRVTIVLLSDETVHEAGNDADHEMLFEERWTPERLLRPNVWKILQSFGIELKDPIVTVLPVKARIDIPVATD